MVDCGAANEYVAMDIAVVDSANKYNSAKIDTVERDNWWHAYQFNDENFARFASTETYKKWARSNPGETHFQAFVTHACGNPYTGTKIHQFYFDISALQQRYCPEKVGKDTPYIPFLLN